ncbi:PepSY domain-containing protein [Paracoccus sp. (in: a-proteobacteria)]|uniref:PepSY domain-containing protein n=1 Tax=Paracoccus sp. TaxID=267 RepID=UPI0028AFAC00|nr:PepSY domain-containing protein [Paracoccus sp. (in: a-proteobacteria)]
MRRILFTLMLGAGLAAGTAALADDDCDRPMQDWVPRHAAEQKAREMGIDVSRVRTDDGCYKVYGRAPDGRSVAIEMDPVTLEVLETEYRKRHRDRDRRRDHGDAAAPSLPQAPANPLIGPSTGRTN